MTQRRIWRPQEREFWDPQNFCPMLQIRPKRGGLRDFFLNSAQRILSAAMIRCYRERKWLVHVKARQEGSSSFFTAIGYQNAGFRRGCDVGILANRHETAEKLNRMALRFYQTTPAEIRPRRDTQLKRWLEFPDLDSRLMIGSVRDAEPFRGDTIQFMVCTEVSAPQWQAHGENAMTAALNAVPDENGMVVAESTPRAHGDPLHELVQESQDPYARWLTVFIPWTMLSEYQTIPPPRWQPKAEVADYAHRHKLTPEQAFWMQSIGLPKCKNKLHRFISEYPIDLDECFGLAGDPIFDSEVLWEWKQRLDGGTGLTAETAEWEVLHEPELDHRYVVAIDPAGSWSKRDRFGMVVLDMTDCKVAATWTGFTTAGKMASFAARQARSYNSAIIAVEANGVGEAVLSHLLEVLAYPYVFHRRAADSIREISDTLVPGFWSGHSTKAAAISYLQDVIEDREIGIASMRLLRQLAGYRGQWDKLQRDEKGGHFDLVAALAIAVWIFFHEVSGGRIRRVRSPKEMATENWERLLHRIGEGTGEGWNTPWGQHL
jgi:hypothetical protein